MSKHAKHLESATAALKATAEKVCAAMFVDTLPEAMSLMQEFRSEHYVLALRGLREEMDFLARRVRQLESAVASEKLTAEQPHG